MTKKSKTRNKVTTSSCAAIESKQEEKGASNLSGTADNTTLAANSKSPQVQNGKFLSHSSGFIHSGSSIKFPNNSTSLAGVPGIVDDFLAPKFVKVLNLKDHGYEKKPPPDLSEIRKAKATDSNANRVEENDSSAHKKNRRKNKPKKNNNVNASYDSEDGRELDVLNVNGNKFPDTIQNQLKSELSNKDAEQLAKLERIRNSAFQYDGNNIVIVPNLVDGPTPPNENCPQYNLSTYPGKNAGSSSCYDDYNFNYEYDGEDMVASGGGPGSASAPSDETSILGLDLENEDDENERIGSWSLSHHHVDYCYPPKQQPSSSVASSESEHNASSSASNASKSYPALASCSTIWDGVINLCEIKDCSKPAAKKCSQCKVAFYCGEDHQRMDWKRHKNECTPYRMESQFGDDISVAVASRNIPQGQLIFSEKPLLVFPVADPENDFLNVMDVPCIKERVVAKQQSWTAGPSLGCSAVKPACFGCLRSVEFIGPPRYRCKKCYLPLCSYNCQMLLAHMMGECQAIETQGGWNEEDRVCFHSMYMDVEILRALQLENYDHLQWERFLQMKQNVRVEAYMQSARYRRFITNYRELVPISAKMTGYHDDLIGSVHAIINALSFRPSLKSAYKLLFATQILFGHDCVPNTFHYLEENSSGLVNNVKLVTKAAMPILKKEPITIDFTPSPFLYYPLRRMVLRNVLSIEDCQCKRCREPSAMNDRSADIKCPRCRHGLICADQPHRWKNSVWACNLCLEEFSYCMVVKITKQCQTELASILSNPRQHVVSALHQFISNREDQDLNPGHSIILQAWSFIEAHLKPSLAATKLPGPGPVYQETILDDYRLLGKCCDAIERHLLAIRPGICYERGCLLLNRYYVEQAISSKRFGLRMIKRKEYIQELMQCVKALQDALKIFQMFEGNNRDVALHIQDTTSALVTTKSFIQQLLVTDNEEGKKLAVVTPAVKETL